jgi:hypothetical protein
MASQDGAQELVVLFDQSGTRPGLEMRYGQFKALLAQKATLDRHADSTVNACYAQVANGLSVRAAVFFVFKVNGEGYVDPAFNLPLDYMAINAGAGPDLGRGSILMACRSQCPVPWHALNMWQPVGQDSRHSAMLVQKLVWRNRLGLKPATLVAHERPARREAQPVPMVQARVQARMQAQAARGQGGADARGDAQAEQPPVISARMAEMHLARVANGGDGSGLQAMKSKLTAALSGAGLHIGQSTRSQREQFGEAANQFREEMERQQRAYLDQIKGCREEIQKLKSALRHEKERNRRLQQLLRGEV